MKHIFCLLFILFSLSTPYHINGGTIDPSISDDKYIEYGSKFPYVVEINGTYKDGTLFSASAVLIDDHNFLTAAHVVANYKILILKVQGKLFLISKAIIHENFKNSVFGKGDIAIGHSEKPFGLKEYPVLYDKKNEKNKECAIVGYGLTGTFETGTKISDDKKRGGSNLIDYISNDILVCSPSRPNTKSHTDLEFMIGSGDSGGGLFIDNKLAGINSCIMCVPGKGGPQSKYGEESGHTRISNFIPWIEQHRKKP